MFETNPLHAEFNGSLWTLPIELRLYCYLAAGWLVLAAAPAIRLRAMSIAVPVAACAFLVLILRGRLFGAPFNAADTRMFMFLYGTTLYLWRDKVPMSRVILVAAFACLVLASFNKEAYFVAYVFLLPPLVLHLAYLPKGRVLAFNDWGDCSYGVYIYAFPIQQTLAFLFPGMPLIAMILCSAAITLGVAALSWTLIERNARWRSRATSPPRPRGRSISAGRRSAAPRVERCGKLSQIRPWRPESQPNPPRKRLGLPWIGLSETSLFKGLWRPPGREVFFPAATNASRARVIDPIVQVRDVSPNSMPSMIP